MWDCPRCQRRFAHRNQSHACGRHELAPHFLGRPRAIRALYRELVRHVQACGPIEVVPEKTRIAFQVRMSFAAVRLGRECLTGHLVLPRRTPHRHFHRIDTISPRNHVHHFRLRTLPDLDPEFDALLRQAYAVGEQRHLVGNEKINPSG